MVLFGNEFKKAMIDNNIPTARNLAKEVNLPYGRIVRALNSDTSSRIVDIIKIATALKLKLVFEDDEDE